MNRRPSRNVVCALLACLHLLHPTATVAKTPVSSGGTTEAFAQLITLDIVPSPGMPPSVTASAVMSVDSSPSCVTAKKPTAGGAAFSPFFVSGNLPVDANSFPVQFTYFAATPYLSSPGYDYEYIAAVTLNVSCSVTPNGGSPSSYNFVVPIYFCELNQFQPAIGLSPSGCQIATTPSTCTISPAGIADPNGYSHNSTTENLQVYAPPSTGSTPPEQIPAIAVDVQLFYNGFSQYTDSHFSPFLVRVACSALSAFTNQ